jgi:hypothetical protein
VFFGGFWLSLKNQPCEAFIGLEKSYVCNYLEIREEGSTPSISANLSIVENLAGLPFSNLQRLSGLIPAMSASLDWVINLALRSAFILSPLTIAVADIIFHSLVVIVVAFISHKRQPNPVSQ